MTVREFMRTRHWLAAWWTQGLVVFGVATIVCVVEGRYTLGIFTAAGALYCWCFIVSTARYGKRSFRVFRFIFRRGYGDY
jgi:hypothetical protein